MRTRFIAMLTGIAITSIVPGVAVFAQVPSKNAAETGFTRQIQTRPALFQLAREIDTTFNAQVGERLIKPMAISARSAHEPDISCNFSCSAFIPRLAILDLEWEETPSATASVSADGSTEHRTLRLDISGTATGFQRESYGTVKLDQIPAKLSKHAQTNTSRSAASSAIAPSPVLLRFVEAGRIVKRASNFTGVSIRQCLKRVDVGINFTGSGSPGHTTRSNDSIPWSGSAHVEICRNPTRQTSPDSHHRRIAARTQLPLPCG